MLTIEEVCIDGRKQGVSPLSSTDDTRPFALESKVKEPEEVPQNAPASSNILVETSPIQVQEAGDFLDIAPIPLLHDQVNDWNSYPPNSGRDNVSLIQSNTTAMCSGLYSPTRTSCNNMVHTTSQGIEQMKNPFFYSQCISGSLREVPNQYPQRDELSHGIETEDDEFSLFIENMIQLT